MKTAPGIVYLYVFTCGTGLIHHVPGLDHRNPGEPSCRETKIHQAESSGTLEVV